LVVVGDDLLHLSLGFAGQDEEYFRDSATLAGYRGERVAVMWERIRPRPFR
jgi:hypothetical protein